MGSNHAGEVTLVTPSHAMCQVAWYRHVHGAGLHQERRPDALDQNALCLRLLRPPARLRGLPAGQLRQVLPGQTRGAGLHTRQRHQVLRGCDVANFINCNNSRNDVDDIEGCERYIFAFGEDEMLMNSEAGLYFKFDEENGIPKNCPGFENFTKDYMKEGTTLTTISLYALYIRSGECWDGNCKNDEVRRAYHMDCPLNDRRMPEDDKAVSEIMEDYATNQDLWLGDFISAFERMTRNGYEDGDLTDAPPSWKPAILTQCKKKSSMIQCWER